MTPPETNDARRRSPPSRRAFAAGLSLLAAGFPLLAVAARAESTAAKPSLLALDFELYDTSGEPGDQSAAHRRRLRKVRELIAGELASRGVFRIADRAGIEADLTAILAQQYLRTCNGCETTLAQKAGADYVMTGLVEKVSTLLMTMKVWLRESKGGGIVYFQPFDFRGDTDESWERAARYLSASLAKRAT